MTLIRTLARACLLAAGIVTAGAAQSAPALLGQWNFQTVTGATSNNGVTVDLIGKGVLNIAQGPTGLSATICWLDENGLITSTRKIEGSYSAGGAIFTHPGTRTTTGRAGKETSTDVRISWTLQANGDVLRGQRLVETDEDEPKPVSGARAPYGAALPAKAPVVEQGSAPENAGERGPSTPAERARVLQMALDAEKNPRQVQARDGAWLATWVNDIPDLNYNNGALANWLGAVAKHGTRDAIQFQYKAGVMAFQINHPKQAELQPAVDLAAMESVLRAYEMLVRTNAQDRSAKLDAALKARNRGELPAFLAALSGRDQD